MKRKVGVFFDVFDPVKTGHLNSALSAVRSLNLSLVLMSLLPEPAHESSDNRWRMLAAACSADKRLVPVRIQNEGLADPSCFLKDLYPEDELIIIRQEAAAGSGSVKGIASAVIHPGSGSAGIPASDIPLPVDEYILASGLYGIPPRIPDSPTWLEHLFAVLNPHRFAHSLSVAATARCLAERFGENADKAEIAGLLHDCAKNLPLNEMRRIIEENGIAADERMMMQDSLLHSVAGACLIQRDYGISDPEIIDAVASHNTGRPGMSRLSMCVCLADSIEPGREPYPHLDDIRRLAEKSLEKALLLSLEGVQAQVLSNGWYLHPRTRDTVAWLRSLQDA